MKKILLIFLFSFSSLFSSEFNEDECISGLSRSNNIPEESINGASDPYFEGYIQALVDMHFYEYKVVVLVKDHTVWLANVHKNKLLAKSIISFVKDVPGVKKVKVLDGVPPKDIIEREKYVNRPRVSGIWFPQSTQLYQTNLKEPPLKAKLHPHSEVNSCLRKRKRGRRFSEGF